MKVLSFISTAQSAVIRRILEHLGVGTVLPRAHGPPGWAVNTGRQASFQDKEDWSRAGREKMAAARRDS